MAQNNSVSVDTGGGSISESSIGIGNVYHKDHSSESSLSCDANSLIQRLREFESEVCKSQDLNPDSANDIRDDLKKSIDAIGRKNPSKTRMMEKLESVQKLLKSLEGTTSSAISLGKLLIPIITAASVLIL